ncbi:MAG: hypothetical protein AAFR16_14645, partial [Pseudomonadota bacterium]
EDACARERAACRAACACPTGDAAAACLAACDQRCPELAACERGEALVEEETAAPPPAVKRRGLAPAATAPTGQQMTPPAAPRVQALESAPALAAADRAEGRLDARILFLRRGEAEPAADFHGYILIGADVSAERKLAVAEGFACRLDTLPDAAAAAAVADLGLVLAPAREAAGGETTTPGAMIAAYDFPRAGRWLRAVERAVGETFDPATAVVFVGSKSARARQLDAVAMPGPGQLGDPVVADGSELSPRYLSRWTATLIDGVRDGRISSRQRLQGLMETHSWLERLGDPLAAVLRFREAAASPPESCL